VEQRRLEAALIAACAEVAVVRAELRQLREAAAGIERATEEWREDYTAALAEHTRRCTSMPLDGLLTAFAELERGIEPMEILSELVTALSREFPRVALCVTGANGIDVVRHTGFVRDETSPLVMSDAVHAIIVRAIESSRLEASLPDGVGLESSLSVDRAAGCAVAVPFAIGTTASAVVYADDPDAAGFSTSMPHARIKFAELLRMYALVLIQRAADRDRAAAARLCSASAPSQMTA
jgi:hypothetical protein